MTLKEFSPFIFGVLFQGTILFNSLQNVILASQAGSSGQTVLLAPQGLRGTTPTTAGTLTVLQQGTQQILLPQGFQGGTLNIKTLQGLKVIPLAQTTASSKGVYIYCNCVSSFNIK